MDTILKYVQKLKRYEFYIIFMDTFYLLIPVISMDTILKYVKKLKRHEFYIIFMDTFYVLVPVISTGSSVSASSA